MAGEFHGRFYGGLDVPLSEAGRHASLQRAAELAARPPDRILSSPLERAAFLARALAAASGAPLQLVDGFIELDRGAWTGRHREELERESPGVVARYLADPEHGNGAGGESESALLQRVWAALDPLLLQHAGQDLVLVAHAHVLRVIMRRLCGWDGPQSLQCFVPLLGVVEAELAPGGTGRLISAPEGIGQDRILQP